MAAQEEDEVYCLCRRPYDPSEFMIECDICNDWFHGRLVAGSPKRRVVFTRLFLINAHQGFDLVAERRRVALGTLSSHSLFESAMITRGCQLKVTCYFHEFIHF